MFHYIMLLVTPIHETPCDTCHPKDSANPVNVSAGAFLSVTIIAFHISHEIYDFNFYKHAFFNFLQDQIIVLRIF